MPVIWRLFLFVYNLLLLLLAATAIGVSSGRLNLIEYINLAVSSKENRIIMGVVAAVLLLLAVYMIVIALKPTRRTDTVLVDSSINGQVSISISAIKLIIMKAVKQVSGIKEINAEVGQATDGLSVKIHMMINPEYSVPELSKLVQDTVKEHLEKIAGLQVNDIKVLVDDFNSVNK